MSVNQELVLSVLREHGPMTISEIMEYIPRAPDSLTCVYKMSKDGLVDVVGIRGRQYVYKVME